LTKITRRACRKKELRPAIPISVLPPRSWFSQGLTSPGLSHKGRGQPCVQPEARLWQAAGPGPDNADADRCGGYGAEDSQAADPAGTGGLAMRLVLRDLAVADLLLGVGSAHRLIP